MNINCDLCEKLCDERAIQFVQKTPFVVCLSCSGNYSDKELIEKLEEKTGIQANQIISEGNLLRLLPHGSGIDYDWQITTHKNGNITAKNAFHAMNEHGYYDGKMPFTVRIYREKQDQFNPLSGVMAGKTQVICRKGDINFSVSCDDKRKASFYDLKNYLNDTIHHSIESIITHRNEVV